MGGLGGVMCEGRKRGDNSPWFKDNLVLSLNRLYGRR